MNRAGKIFTVEDKSIGLSSDISVLNNTDIGYGDLVFNDTNDGPYTQGLYTIIESTSYIASLSNITSANGWQWHVGEWGIIPGTNASFKVETAPEST